MTWTWSGGRKELVASVFLLAMTVSHLVMGLGVAPLLRGGYQDFTIFYTAGKLVRGGQTAALYDLTAQYRAQQEFAPDVHVRQAALPYNHPPFEALFFVPFAFLPYLPAYVIWTVLNLIMLATALTLLRKQFAELQMLSPAVLSLAATGFFPIAIAIIQCQDAILLLLIFVLGLVFLDRKRDVTAGALLAIGLFKFHLVAPLVLLLAMRRVRLLTGFLPVAAAFAGVSVAMLRWDGTVRYIQFVLQLEQSGARGAIVAADMPNLRGLIAFLPGISAASGLTTMLTLVSSAAVFVIALWRIRRDSLSSAFALATVTSILISYHLLVYDLSLLLPGAVFLFAEMGDAKHTARRVTEMLLLLLLFLTPLYVLLRFYLDRLCWFALVLLCLFVTLARAHPATENPA